MSISIWCCELQVRWCSIQATNIYWVLIMCQTLCQMLGTKGKTVLEPQAWNSQFIGTDPLMSDLFHSEGWLWTQKFILCNKSPGESLVPLWMAIGGRWHMLSLEGVWRSFSNRKGWQEGELHVDMKHMRTPASLLMYFRGKWDTGKS